MVWTDTQDFDVLPGRATDAVAAVLDRLDPCRALAGTESEDAPLPPDGDLDDDLDEDDELDDDEDDEDLDDELIDLDDEYDDTDEDDRPHPGHRYDE
jgi:hypothetical protein